MLCVLVSGYLVMFFFLVRDVDFFRCSFTGRFKVLGFRGVRCFRRFFFIFIWGGYGFRFIGVSIEFGFFREERKFCNLAV